MQRSADSEIVREREIHAGCRRIVERCRRRVAESVPKPDPIDGPSRRVIRGLRRLHEAADAVDPTAAIDIICQSPEKFREHVAAGRLELRGGVVPISSIEKYLRGAVGHYEPGTPGDVR